MVSSASPRLRPTPVPGLARATFAAIAARGEDSTAEFERAAARMAGTAHAVSVGSARAGLAIALAHEGVRAGDEVLVPSFTAPCVPGFLRALGLRVRIATVCPRRLVVTGETVAAARSPRTRAVLPTHVEGVVAPMAEVAAAGHGLVLVEDAAHAFGATSDGRAIGTFGAGAIHSFGKGKQVNTLFGGMVTTDRDDVAAALRRDRDGAPAPSASRLVRASLLELGIEAATHPRLYPLLLHPVIRAFSRLGVDLPTRLFEDDGRADPASLRLRPPAAWGRLGLSQLATLPSRRAARRALATRLRTALRARGFSVQDEGGAGDHPLFVTFFHADREALRRALMAQGVDTQPTWMRAIVDDEGRSDPIAVRAAREGLYVPLHDADADAFLAALDRAGAA